MDLTNIVSSWEMDDNKTILVTDSPAFNHFELATRIEFNIFSKLFIETKYSNILNNKLMIAFDIKDQEERCSIYLTYNRLFGFINDLYKVLEKNLYGEGGWFVKYNNSIQLNEERIESNTLNDVKILINDDKYFTIKPWKNASSPEPSLILSLNRGDKFTNIDLPVPLFEMMLEKIVELKNNFETIKIGLHNQFISSKILKSLSGEVETVETRAPSNNQTEISATPAPIIEEKVQEKMVEVLSEAILDDLEEEELQVIESLPSHPNPINELNNEEDQPTPKDSDTNDPNKILIKDNFRKSLLISKLGNLKHIASEFSVLHVNNSNLQDDLYCNNAVLDLMNSNKLKQHIDLLLKPLDKENMKTDHLVYKLRDMKVFPFYDNKDFVAADSVRIIETIIIGAMIAMIRTKLNSNQQDKQVIFRTFMTLTYENILVYMLSIHYNHIMKLIEDNKLETLVTSIIDTYKTKQIYITEQCNKQLNEYGDVDVSILFKADVFINLIEKLVKNIPQEIKVEKKELLKSPGVPLVTTEDTVVKPSVSTPEVKDVVIPDVPLITMVASKLISDKSTADIINNVLMKCKHSIAEVLDHENLDMLLTKIDTCNLITKTLIVEWCPIGKLHHRDFELFKKYCNNLSNEQKTYSPEQIKECELAISLKLSAMVGIKNIYETNKTEIDKLLDGYDYYKNVENLYNDKVQSINKITTNPFVTGLIIEYYVGILLTAINLH